MTVLSAEITVTVTTINPEARIDSAGLLGSVCRNAVAPRREPDANIDLLQRSGPPNP